MIRLTIAMMDELDCMMVELPYKGERIVMQILLPNKRTGVFELEDKLMGADLQSEFRKMQHKVKVDLSLPKFKLSHSLPLSESLQEMGMGDMFSDATADFSGINGDGPLIDQQQQQPNVETCKRLLRDFPTAFDNYKICKKVKEAGKFLDWLRANRNLCETSEDHYEAFVSNNCGGVWCEVASRQRGQWEAEYDACSRGETEDNSQDCKILQNRLKAFNALSC